MNNVTSDQWFDIVAETLTEHPEFASATVQAMQDGLLRALDRKSERLAVVSLALVEALNTKPEHVKRDHDRIVAGITASNYHPTKWSAEMIARERET